MNRKCTKIFKINFVSNKMRVATFINLSKSRYCKCISLQSGTDKDKQMADNKWFHVECNYPSSLHLHPYTLYELKYWRIDRFPKIHIYVLGEWRKYIHLNLNGRTRRTVPLPNQILNILLFNLVHFLHFEWLDRFPWSQIWIVWHNIRIRDFRKYTHVAHKMRWGD